MFELSLSNWSPVPSKHSTRFLGSPGTLDGITSSSTITLPPPERIKEEVLGVVSGVSVKDDIYGEHGSVLADVLEDAENLEPVALSGWGGGLLVVAMAGDEVAPCLAQFFLGRRCPRRQAEVLVSASTTEQARAYG